MRKRIIRGKLSIITKNDHKIYATKGNISNNAATNVIQVGEDKGVSYGKCKEPPAPISFAKCSVNFRPHSSWQGEFGFDWNRKGDSNMPVDFAYNKIIGEYGSIYATEPEAVFTPLLSKYNVYLNEYESLVLYNGKYHIPNMTLMAGKEAELDIITEVKEIPDKIHYAYNKAVFELTILKKITKTVGSNYDEKAVRIKCKKEFNNKESIRVIATKDGKMQKVGQINIFPNCNIKEVKIVLIPVNVAKMNATGKVKNNELEVVRNAFSQAYLKANILTYPNKIEATGFWFNWRFTTKDENGNMVMELSMWKSLHRSLDELFFEIKGNSKYENYYRVYMLPNSLDLNGVAEGIGNTKVVAVFQNRNNSSTSHELLHAMGLYHTFDNNSDYTFQLNHTDNIMDYTHHKGKKRFSTNKFQWEILNSGIR